MLKKSAADAFKTASKWANQNTAEATGNSIGDKIDNAVAESYEDRITGSLKSSQQNNSEIVTNKHDKEIPKKRYISRRNTKNHWWAEIEIKSKFQKIYKRIIQRQL